MRKHLFLIGSSLLFVQQAQAEDVFAADDCLNCITVTATGIAQPVDEVGQPLSIIDDQEIARVQGPDISRVLKRMPGVSMTRNGPLGSFTGVRVRGAASEALLVLVDGVRVADVAAPAGGFDFGTLTSGGISKIELLRGSNSVIWGSDAIGGVMNIATRVEKGASASIEYGGDRQLTAQAALGHADERLTAGLNAGYVHSRGFSSAAAGTEADGFEQFYLSSHSRLEVAPGLALTADGRYAEGKTEIDGYGPAPDYAFGDTHERQDTRQVSGRLGADYSSDLLDLRAGYSLADTARDLLDEDAVGKPYFSSSGRSERAELFGRLRLPSQLRLDFGADKEWTRYSTHDRGPWATLPVVRAKADIASAHAMLGYYGDHFILAAGARIDDHSRFGSQWTFGANSSFEVTSNLRLRASYGEGFKAPSLFQLLSDYGNANLKPETSKAYDLGVEYNGKGNGLYAAVSLFRRDTTNLIDFVSCYLVSTGICTDRPNGSYDNIGRTRAEGVEVELRYAISPSLMVQGVYSHVHAKDRTAGSFTKGNALARRPGHTGTVSVDWTGPAQLALGADLRVVGASWDDAYNSTRLRAYAVADLRMSIPVSRQVELFGRIENVTNEHYQTAAGYGTQGRAAFVGARLRM